MTVPTNNEGALWRARWETTSAHLAVSRAECIRLRSALNELNQDVEWLLSRAGQDGVENAKSWLIKQQRKTISAARRPPVSGDNALSDELLRRTYLDAAVIETKKLNVGAHNLDSRMREIDRAGLRAVANLAVSQSREAAPSDTDLRDAVVDAIWSTAIPPVGSHAIGYLGTLNPDKIADAILPLLSRTSRPVQVEVTGHSITQRMPWPPYPGAIYMLSLFECSCGWTGSVFEDRRDNQANISEGRQAAEAHAAALGGGE